MTNGSAEDVSWVWGSLWRGRGQDFMSLQSTQVKRSHPRKTSIQDAVAIRIGDSSHPPEDREIRLIASCFAGTWMGGQV